MSTTVQKRSLGGPDLAGIVRNIGTGGLEPGSGETSDEEPLAHDVNRALRILVDRLWPRGLTKADAQVDYWPKELAPSNELRKWYSHDATKWSQFKQRYRKELAGKPKEVESLLDFVRGKKVTFVFGSKEERLNNAVALKEFVESKL